MASNALEQAYWIAIEIASYLFLIWGAFWCLKKLVAPVIRDILTGWRTF